MKMKTKKTAKERIKSKMKLLKNGLHCPQPSKAEMQVQGVIRLDSSTIAVGENGRAVLASLLQKYRDTGDARIATWLFNQFWHLVLGSAFRYLGDRDAAQDAAMEIFHKVLERLRSETPTHFPAWLYTVTRNHCIEILRKAKKSPILEPLESKSVMNLPDEDLLENAEFKASIMRKVRAALVNLPEHQRTCVELFYIEELSYKEISEESGYSLNMVKSFIQNGKRRLLMSLEGDGGRRISDCNSF
jgi:RNA polymerase sigma factor (sigma-70 family)